MGTTALVRRSTSEISSPQNASAMEDTITWWDGYLNVIVWTSLFGGQITFTLIASDILDPATVHPIGTTFRTHPIFGKELVRTFLAISWLLFMLALGTSLIAKTQLSDAGIRDVILLRGPERLKAVHSLLTFILNALPLTAITFLALSVIAYVPCVGWICIGFLGFFVLLIGVLWVLFDLRGMRKLRQHANSVREMSTTAAVREAESPFGP